MWCARRYGHADPSGAAPFPAMAHTPIVFPEGDGMPDPAPTGRATPRVPRTPRTPRGPGGVSRDVTGGVSRDVTGAREGSGVPGGVLGQVRDAAAVRLQKAVRQFLYRCRADSLLRQWAVGFAPEVSVM